MSDLNIPFNPRSRRSAYRSRLNRKQSLWKIALIPSASVMLGSMVTALPIMVDHAILPPLGLLMLLGWRLLRHNSWPLWIGFPLGVWDDLYSGQPFGSSALIWSIILLAYQFIENRVSWRNYWTEWFSAAVAILFALSAGLFIVGLIQPQPAFSNIFLQMAVSVLFFPLVLRLCAVLDGWRLSA